MLREITDKTNWNDFVLSCRPNTFLHSWEWGQVQVKSGEKVRYLGIYQEDEQIGAALVITVNAKRGRHYLIPHGPLFKQDDHPSRVELFNELITYLRQQAQPDSTVAVKIAPLLIDNEENRQLFKNLRFRPAPLHVHAELTWVLDIDQSEDQLLQAMRKTTRHAIIKAERNGVEVSISTNPADIDRFWPLYKTTKSRHHFIPFPKSFIQSQLDEFGQANRFFIVIASHQGQDVAAAIFIHFGGTVYYYHGASVKTPSSIPATQLLQWRAIQEAKRRGATKFNFWGISPANKPNHPFAGITTFKKGFGGQALNYLHAQDMPLSIQYWKLWVIESYRKLRRGF